MKVWTVYQVENRVNGRLYIGVHKTVDPNDEYMGSGKLIRFAIEKHGLENFRKKVLLTTESKEEAFALEKSLVSLERIESGELYNLKEGGEGGWDWCNRNLDLLERNRLISRLRSYEEPGMRSPLKLETARKTFLARNTDPRRFMWSSLAFKGKSHTEETKEKIRVKAKIRDAEFGNSQKGTWWITDGEKEKKIPAFSDIPSGWNRGRNHKQRTANSTVRVPAS